MPAPNQLDPRTVNEWCDAFGKLDCQAEHHRQPEDAWIAALARFSEMGEAIRRTAYKELIDAAARAFRWLCTFSEYIKPANCPDRQLFQMQDGLCDIVYFKYPDRCGHCLWVPCRCDPALMDSMPNKGSRYAELHRRWERGRRKYRGAIGLTILDWFDMYKEIYGGRIHMSPLTDIGFHFQEEAGEETSGILKLLQLSGLLERKLPGVDKDFLDEICSSVSTVTGLVQEYVDGDFPRDATTGKPEVSITNPDPRYIRARIVDAKMDMVVELADTFSWFCAILLKHEETLKQSELWKANDDFETILQITYGAKGNDLTCPECQGQGCGCLVSHPAS